MKLRTLLHIFIMIMFVVGVTLAYTTFSAYSKLQATCASARLRLNLRIAMIIAAMFITVSMGYVACSSASSCRCSFGDSAGTKLYVLLALVMGMGIYLIILAGQVSDDMKICAVAVGPITDVLMGFGIAMSVIPLLYLSALHYSNKGVLGSSNIDDEEDSDEVVMMKRMAEEQTQLNKTRASVAKNLAALKVKEATAVSEVSSYESRGKKAPDNKMAQVTLLKAQVSRRTSDIAKLDSEISSKSSMLEGKSASKPSRPAWMN